MKLKWIFAAGTVVGIAIASRRRSQRAAAEGDRWAAATDPVDPQPEA